MAKQNLKLLSLTNIANFPTQKFEQIILTINAAVIFISNKKKNSCSRGGVQSTKTHRSAHW